MIESLRSNETIWTLRCGSRTCASRRTKPAGPAPESVGTRATTSDGPERGGGATILGNSESRGVRPDTNRGTRGYDLREIQRPSIDTNFRRGSSASEALDAEEREKGKGRVRPTTAEEPSSFDVGRLAPLSKSIRLRTSNRSPAEAAAVKRRSSVAADQRCSSRNVGETTGAGRGRRKAHRQFSRRSQSSSGPTVSRSGSSPGRVAVSRVPDDRSSAAMRSPLKDCALVHDVAASNASGPPSTTTTTAGRSSAGRLTRTESNIHSASGRYECRARRRR